MDGEIIDALFGLLDQCIPEDLPGQVFGPAIGLVQCLIDGNRANRHGRVADDPFARFMNVLSGRKVHDGIAAPADRPGHFLHFFANRGT